MIHLVLVRIRWGIMRNIHIGYMMVHVILLVQHILTPQQDKYVFLCFLVGSRRERFIIFHQYIDASSMLICSGYLIFAAILRTSQHVFLDLYCSFFEDYATMLPIISRYI